MVDDTPLSFKMISPCWICEISEPEIIPCSLQILWGQILVFFASIAKLSGKLSKKSFSYFNFIKVNFKEIWFKEMSDCKK